MHIEVPLPPCPAAFEAPVAPVSEDSLAQREAARSGVLPWQPGAGKGQPESPASASERAYSVAAAAGLIPETPPLRRIYSSSSDAEAAADAKVAPATSPAASPRCSPPTRHETTEQDETDSSSLVGRFRDTANGCGSNRRPVSPPRLTQTAPAEACAVDGGSAVPAGNPTDSTDHNAGQDGSPPTSNRGGVASSSPRGDAATVRGFSSSHAGALLSVATKLKQDFDYHMASKKSSTAWGSAGLT